MTNRDKRLLQRLAYIEFSRHILPSGDKRPSSDTHFIIDSRYFPSKIRYGDYMDYRRMLLKNDSESRQDDDSQTERHLHNIVRDRRERSGSNESSVITILYSIGGIYHYDSLSYIAEIDKRKLQGNDIDPHLQASMDGFDCVKRAPCVGEDGNPLETRFDEVDEILRRVRLEALMSCREPWRKELLDEVIDKYLAEVEDARKPPVFY